jgi:hypothetical protein
MRPISASENAVSRPWRPPAVLCRSVSRARRAAGSGGRQPAQRMRSGGRCLRRRTAARSRGLASKRSDREIATFVGRPGEYEPLACRPTYPPRRITAVKRTGAPRSSPDVSSSGVSSTEAVGHRAPQRGAATADTCTCRTARRPTTPTPRSPDVGRRRAVSPALAIPSPALEPTGRASSFGPGHTPRSQLAHLPGDNQARRAAGCWPSSGSGPRCGRGVSGGLGGELAETPYCGCS